MAGYIRQSIADITPGNDVDAEPLNNEFNALQDAFHSTSGHPHDGAAGNGPKINLTTSVVGLLPITLGGSGASTASGARTNFGLGTAAVQNIGTSGANIPYMNGSNTWSGPQVFTANIAVEGAGPQIRLTDTDTNADSLISANSANGSLIFSADANNEVASTVIQFNIDGNSAATLSAAGNLTLAGTVGVSSGGTGAITAQGARAALSVDYYSGSSETNTDYPVGSYLMVLCTGSPDRNSSATLYYSVSDPEFFTNTATGGNVALSGTWRSRGAIRYDASGISGNYTCLFQRVS
jgi:hypothetical protein